MNRKKSINATLVALFLFAFLLSIFISDKNTAKAQEVYTFTEIATPGFWIWEDPNTPYYYAYDTQMLTGSLKRFHFQIDEYDSGIAFIRIGRNKPKINPNTGETVDYSKLRLVEVRPYGHDAFYPSEVEIEQNKDRVLIEIFGIDFFKTPHVEIYNPHKKGSWEYGTEIYSENHHIPLELVWQYEYTNEPETYSCPPSGVQTKVTKESGKRYYSCNCDEDGCEVCVETYYETTEMEVIAKPTVIKAGQGTEIIVVTNYSNNNPNHVNQPFATGNVFVTGIDSENYPSINSITLDLIANKSNPFYMAGKCGMEITICHV